MDLRSWRGRWRRPVIIVVLLVAVAALYWFGIWIPNRPSITTYPVRGLDVSHHQGPIDWVAVKNAGMTFAYIKATEGSDYKDPAFVRNWSDSAAAGIARGAYHFFTLGTSGQLQANNFIATVPVESSVLPPAIDLEFSGYNVGRNIAGNDFVRELSVFYDALVTRYDKLPVVYTTYRFKKQYLRSMPLDRLWIREILTKPRLEAEPWIFWQFSARSRVAGISTFVDVDVFKGNADEFRDLIKNHR
jgi:lysozyme